MTMLETQELDLLISFHRSKQEWHHDRAVKLEQMRDMTHANRELAAVGESPQVDQNASKVPEPDPGPGKQPEPPETKPDCPENPADAPVFSFAAEQMRWVTQALKDPAPGNRGMTLRGIVDYVNGRNNKIISIPALDQILEKLVDKGMVREDDGMWIHVNANSRVARTKADASKGGRTGRKGKSCAGLKTPQGEPISRSRAILLIMIKTHQDGGRSMTTREICDRLHADFGDYAEAKTVNAALCGMRNRKPVYRTADRKWSIKNPDGGAE